MTTATTTTDMTFDEADAIAHPVTHRFESWNDSHPCVVYATVTGDDVRFIRHGFDVVIATATLATVPGSTAIGATGFRFTADAADMFDGDFGAWVVATFATPMDTASVTSFMYHVDRAFRFYTRGPVADRFTVVNIE